MENDQQKDELSDLERQIDEAKLALEEISGRTERRIAEIREEGELKDGEFEAIRRRYMDAISALNGEQEELKGEVAAAQRKLDELQRGWEAMSATKRNELSADPRLTRESVLKQISEALARDSKSPAFTLPRPVLERMVDIVASAHKKRIDDGCAAPTLLRFSKGEYIVLGLLIEAGAHGITIGEITERVGNARSTMQSMITNLRSHGVNVGKDADRYFLPDLPA